MLGTLSKSESFKQKSTLLHVSCSLLPNFNVCKIIFNIRKLRVSHYNSVQVKLNSGSFLIYIFLSGWYSLFLLNLALPISVLDVVLVCKLYW